MKRKNVALIQVACAALLWSSGGVFVKLINADPVFIAAARSAAAGILLLPFIKFKKIKFSWDLIGLIIAYSYNVCAIVVSTKLTAAVNAIMLQYTAPLWIFLGIVITKKKISIRKTIPIIFVAAGIVLFLSEPVKGTSSLGNIIAVTSGIAFALTTYFFHKLKDISGIGLVGLCNISASLLMLLIIPHNISLVSIDILGWFALIYLGAFQIAFPFILYSKALKTIEPLKATIIGLIEPIMNPVWVYIFVHEVPTMYAVLGSVCVIVGIIVDTTINNTKQKQTLRV